MPAVHFRLAAAYPKVTKRHLRSSFSCASAECSSNGDPVELKRVLDTGVDPSTPNGIGQTGLHVCCIWGNHECLQILIEAGADLNAQNTLTGATPLHFAADDDTGRGDAKGRRICLQLLLDAGADKDIQDSRGRRPYQNSTNPEVRVALGGPAELADYAEEPAAAGQASRLQAAFGISRCVPCPK